MDSSQLEQAVIGACLINYTLEAREAIEMLTPGVFTDNTLKAAYEAIRGLDNDYEVVDLVTVTEVVEKKIPGSLCYLAEIAKNTPGSASIKAYSKKLRELAGKRFAKLKLDEAISLLQGHCDDDGVKAAITQALDAMEAGKNEIRWEYADHLSKLEFERMQRVIDSPDQELGYITGIAGIDQALGKVNRTDLVLIAGRPGMGKTTLAITIADAYAITQDRASLFFSMEMENGQLIQKQIAMGGRFAASLMRDPYDLGDDGMARVTEGTKRLIDKKLAYCDAPNLTLNQIRNLARKFANRHEKLGGIFIDYITLMKINSDVNRHVAIGDISGGLKALAKEIKMPVFLLSQLNRSLESRPDKRPLASDLRESGALEQDADRIIFPYRDNVYNGNTQFKNFCEIINGKNRHEACKTGWMKFVDGNFYELTEFDEQEIYKIKNQQKQSKNNRIDNESF